jgi:uncharacterized protein with HEPN domain
MSRKKEDPLRLRHMIEFAEKAIKLAKGRRRRDIEQDEQLAMSLARAIEIAGEAASRVSAETRKQARQIPWAKIVGMRNRLIHGYDQIDHDVLWSTVRNDLRPLIREIRKLLASLSDEEE